VDYGQRHRRELWSALQVARYYGATHEVLKLPPALFAGSALTADVLPTLRASQHFVGAPTVVPGRNLVLASLAVTAAVRAGAKRVWLAPTLDDQPVYPDCRSEFVADLARAAQSGYGVEVLAPFCAMTKREVVTLGRSLGVPFDLTWSCYDPQGHDQLAPASGVPCEKCGACVVRAGALA
jgi:7-cyano-7-deazaguanine synthase